MNDAELSQASSEYWNQEKAASLIDVEPPATVFVVVWESGTITTADEEWVSRTYDLADFDYGDGIKQILALNEKTELVPIEIGEHRHINLDQEDPFFFANAPIMAGTRIVGYVTYTDH